MTDHIVRIDEIAARCSGRDRFGRLTDVMGRYTAAACGRWPTPPTSDVGEWGFQQRNSPADLIPVTESW